jgi:hypothetical protein
MIPFHRLLRYRFIALWNGSLSHHSRHRTMNWVMVVFVIPWMFLFFGGVGVGMGRAARDAPAAPLLLAWIVTGILASEFLLMLVGEVGGFANLLFFSGRGEWLRRAPVSGRRFLLYQVVEGTLVMAAVPTMLLFVVFLCVLVGYKASAAVILGGVLAFALVRLMPLGLSLVTVWLLAPRTSRETFRWLDAILGLLFGFLMLALWRVNLDPDAMLGLIEGRNVPPIPTLLIALFPPAAVGSITSTLLAGGSLPLYTVLLAVTQTALLVGLPLALADRWLAEGRYPEAGSSSVRSRTWWGGPSGPFFAMLRKDTLVFLREGRLGLRLISSAATTLMVIWFVFAHQGSAGGSPALLMLFLISSEAGMLVIPSEGKGMVWTAGSPLSPRVFVLAKMGVAMFFTAVTASVPLLVLGLGRDWPPRAWGVAFLAGPLVALMGASAGILLAARWGRLDWDDPRRMLQPAAHLLHGVFIVVGFIAVATAGALATEDALAVRTWALAALAGASALVTWFSLALAIRAVARKEWLV